MDIQRTSVVQPVLIPPGAPIRFPDPRFADQEGLVAVGGDLLPERLLAAYDHGIFPWYSEGYPPLWWCPDPRAILPLEAVHMTRSMRRRLRRGDFRVTWNHCFERVLHECGAGRSEGTWLTPEMTRAYMTLRHLGHAHSLEVWRDSQLVGGLYGVQRGGLFAAESMFHRQTDMSKVALLYCCSSLLTAGVGLFDVQFLTPHLASLGAREISRREYLHRVRVERERRINLNHLQLVSPLS